MCLLGPGWGWGQQQQPWLSQRTRGTGIGWLSLAMVALQVRCLLHPVMQCHCDPRHLGSLALG